jgi:hypothetical protein
MCCALVAALSQPASELRSAATNSICVALEAIFPMLARTTSLLATLLKVVLTRQPSFKSSAMQ